MKVREAEACQQRPLIYLFAARCEMAMDARGCRFGFGPNCCEMAAAWWAV